MTTFKRTCTLLSVITFAFTAWAQAPAWDTSGNGLLNGTYNFREVFYQTGDSLGTLSQGAALSGQITFDGSGHYTLSNSTLLTYTQGTPVSRAYPGSGSYSIAASGHGFLSGLYCPLTAGCPTNVLNVLVSRGMVVGSSPDSNLNDVFIGAAIGAPLATNATFQGPWTMAGYVPSISASVGNAGDAFFQVTPDGAGNLGTVNVTGYFGKDNGAQAVQPAAGVTYSFTNGVATLVFPASPPAPAFLTGNQTLYFSADGTFCFGGSASFPNLIVGVRNAPAGSIQTLTGIYYGAGIDENEHFFATKGSSDFFTFYGAFNTVAGNILYADRVRNPSNITAVSSAHAATYPLAIDSTYIYAGLTRYSVNANGTIRIGAGIGPYLSLSVAIQAPTLDGPGVFLNPMGISNGASFAPFTEGISPGELTILYGSGFAPTNTIGTTLPLLTNLGGVQVTINGVAAPLFYTTPGQIAFMVPYGTTGPVAEIQVINNGTKSNIVTDYVHVTTPGIFTLPSGGIGFGALEHADGSLISSASPAHPGERVVVFVGGLGAVTPAITDGDPASLTVLTHTNASITAFIGATPASVAFAGAAPGFAGLYQVNVDVPATAQAGDIVFELDGPDSESTQAVIPIAPSL